MTGDPACPVCHDRMKYRFNKFGHDFFQCRSCQFAAFHPTPDRKSILNRYSEGYFNEEYLPSYGASSDSVNLEIIHNRFDFLERMVRQYHPDIPKRKKMLDIGCGAGFLLKTFQDRGWEVLGMDIMDSSAEYGGRMLGIPIEKCDFETVSPDEISRKYGPFDLVAMTDSLEHFFDPFVVLENTFHILKNRGVLFVSVPNIESISFKLIGKQWAIVSPLEHLSYFSPVSLRRILENSGFENITIFMLQGVNLANIHRKTLRYRMARMAIYLISRITHLGFEGRESYHEVLNEKYLTENQKRLVMGDVLFALGQKKNEY